MLPYCSFGASYEKAIGVRSIAENLSIYGDDANVSELLELFNETNDLYEQELGNYNEITEEIESEYGKYFNPIRETP